MRFVFLISGATGFLLATVVGFQAERPADHILRDAALVCLGSALLGRWFWGTVERAARETSDLRRAAAAAVAQTENKSTPPAPPLGRSSRSVSPSVTAERNS